MKCEYQLQERRGMVQVGTESRLSAKAWCAEHEITEHVYYHRLCQLRMATCHALLKA